MGVGIDVVFLVLMCLFCEIVQFFVKFRV